MVNGRRCPILGRVCMDQFMADITDVPDVSVGTEVTLIGTDGTQQLTMEEACAESVCKRRQSGCV